jgi:hypothetical protein
MKENNITRKSIEITNNIIYKMESHSFHNHFHILYDICDLIGENITYLEIGCYAGASASLVSSHRYVKKSYSVDLGIPIDKSIPIINVNKFKNPSCIYEYIQGDSNNEEVINLVNSKLNNINLFLIDGDHSYEGVIRDFYNYVGLVSENGYIVFDDYLDSQYSPQVKPAVDQIVKDLDKSIFEVIGSIKYDLIKETNLPNHTSSNMFILKKNKI